MGEEYILCYQGQEPFTVTSQKEMAEHILKGAAFNGMAIPEGMVLVKIEPITGKNYEAGLWSRRNYEAWQEDQHTAAQGERK